MLQGRVRAETIWISSGQRVAVITRKSWVFQSKVSQVSFIFPTKVWQFPGLLFLFLTKILEATICFPTIFPHDRAATLKPDPRHNSALRYKEYNSFSLTPDKRQYILAATASSKRPELGGVLLEELLTIGSPLRPIVLCLLLLLSFISPVARMIHWNRRPRP